MKVNLHELEAGESVFLFKESPEELDIKDPTLRFSGLIRTNIVIYKLIDSLSVEGESAFKVLVECSLCLKRLELPLTSKFKFIFQKEDSKRLESFQDETFILSNNCSREIDLGEQIKDYIFLEIPLNPICNKSCAGLCTICGENLNTRKCECKKETFDPRWEALQDLKTN